MMCDLCSDDSPIISVISLAPKPGRAYVLLLKCEGCVRRAILELQAILAGRDAAPPSVEDDTNTD